jgi:hypothetical protein
VEEKLDVALASQYAAAGKKNAKTQRHRANLSRSARVAHADADSLTRQANATTGFRTVRNFLLTSSPQMKLSSLIFFKNIKSTPPTVCLKTRIKLSSLIFFFAKTLKELIQQFGKKT